MLTTQTNVPLEVSLKSAATYTDVSNEIEVNVVLSDPQNVQRKIPAFWAGTDEFRFRFAANAPGIYSWQTVCTNPDDTGLHGQQGEIQVTEYQEDNPLYQHGRLKAATSGRTLEHADGTPFLWLGDTWWMGLTKRLDWPHGFQDLTADRVNKGFNVVQIVAGPLPDFDSVNAAWHPQQANENGWSWEKGWERINPAFYDLADLRITHLVKNGIVPCIVGMWAFYLPEMGVDKVKQHWRNLIARYGAYPVVWCAAGEVNLPAYCHLRDAEKVEALQAVQKQGWTEVAAYMNDIDPFDNPITAHPCFPDSRGVLADESMLDINMLQTGHGGYPTMKRSLEMLDESMAKTPAMPTLNSEVCYEGIMGANKDEVQRFLVWSHLLSGAAGHTYGAQGIWAMSSRDEPFIGSTASWGDGFWQDVMHLPGSAHTGLVRSLFEQYPWWNFMPRKPEGKEREKLDELERVYPLATGIPGEVLIFYFCCGCMESALKGYQHDGPVLKIEPDENYQAYYFNPRNGAKVVSYPGWLTDEISIANVTPDSDGYWKIPPKPTMEDWVLVLHNPEKYQLA